MSVEKVITEETKPYHTVRVLNEGGSRKLQMLKDDEVIREVDMTNHSLSDCVSEAKNWLSALQMV